MNKTVLSDFNFQITLLGGQAFNWDFKDGYYWGFTKDKIVKLNPVERKHNKISLWWQTYPENDDYDFIKEYLRLNVNYKNILKKINKDKHIKNAMKKFPNIRLLKQDFEQTLLSFMTSSNNNIPSIRKIIRSLCVKFGRKITVDKNEIYLFPKTEIIAEAKLEDLLECKLGFRAKFIKNAAKFILKKNLTERIITLDESNARESLLEINGIGEKIADCILVFSMGFDNVTPLDVWGKRFLLNFYNLNPKMKYQDMRSWLAEYFDGHSAWAGQFLYEYIRNQQRKV